jgi:hypothetical protein
MSEELIEELRVLCDKATRRLGGPTDERLKVTQQMLTDRHPVDVWRFDVRLADGRDLDIRYCDEDDWEVILWTGCSQEVFYVRGVITEIAPPERLEWLCDYLRQLMVLDELAEVADGEVREG